MRLVLPAGATALALLAAAATARADRRPTLATDGFYVGTRLDPGVALAAGWDLDIYLTRNRALSLGPGLFLSVLGGAAGGPGQQQDLLLSVDVLRVKVGLNAPGSEWRPFVVAGGGFSYARLPAQTRDGVTITLPSGETATGVQHFDALEDFAPIISFGAGADLFIVGPIGATAMILAHAHPAGSSRVPDLWLDLALGIRFGL